MQVVIEMDEELYNYMQTDEYDEHLDKRFDYQIRFAVKDGIPLPKVHGLKHCKIIAEDEKWDLVGNKESKEVHMSEVKPSKCSSAEGSSDVNEANIGLLYELYNENVKLRKKLKKIRKEKKRWKRKYFKLYNDAIFDLPEGFGLKTVSEGLDLFKKK